LTVPQKGFHAAIDVLKLGIPVRMLLTPLVANHPPLFGRHGLEIPVFGGHLAAAASLHRW
jgi:hypothetical protein